MNQCLKHNKEIIGSYEGKFMCQDCLELKKEEEKLDYYFPIIWTIGGIISFISVLLLLHNEDGEWHYIMATIFGLFGPVGVILVLFLIIISYFR